MEDPQIQERPFAAIHPLSFLPGEQDQRQEESGKQDGAHGRDFSMAQFRASQEKAGEAYGQVQEAHEIKAFLPDIRGLPH